MRKETNRKFRKAGVICSAPKGVLLKLQQLDDQPRQRLTGWTISLNILEMKTQTRSVKLRHHQLPKNVLPSNVVMCVLVRVTTKKKMSKSIAAFRSFNVDSLYSDYSPI